jgi:hypothetical protein
MRVSGVRCGNCGCYDDSRERQSALQRHAICDPPVQTHVHHLSIRAALQLKLAFSGGAQKSAQRAVKAAPVFARGPLAYRDAGAALAIADGEGLMARAFAWPDTIGRIVVVVLLLGLPVALTIS